MYAHQHAASPGMVLMVHGCNFKFASSYSSIGASSRRRRHSPHRKRAGSSRLIGDLSRSISGPQDGGARSDGLVRATKLLRRRRYSRRKSSFFVICTCISCFTCCILEKLISIFTDSKVVAPLIHTVSLFKEKSISVTVKVLPQTQNKKRAAIRHNAPLNRN